MESNIDFDIQKEINDWTKQLSSCSSFTDSDAEELKCHLLDLIDDLKEKGLDDDEAFLVAKRRLGNSLDLVEEYRFVNNPIIQIRRSLIILAGVLIYFFSYYLLKFSSKFLLVLLLWLDVNGQIAISWVGRYLTSAHFIYLAFAVSIFFYENRAIIFIESIKVKPKNVIYLLVMTISFGIFDTCLSPIVANFMKSVPYVRNKFYDINFYFQYTFPLLICLSFVLLYIKYFKKSKLH